MSSKRKLVITNNSCLKLIDRVKRQRGKCGHSSNPTPPKIDFTVLNAPLSVVFQFIDTKALVSRVSHCNKQFHSVSKNANAWRYSKCLVNIQSRGPFECPLEHLPMLRRLNLFNRDYIPPANLCFLAKDLEFVPQLNALELISFYFHSPDNLANSYYTGFNILIQNLKVLPVLHTLDLVGVVDDTGCVLLAGSLKHCPLLTYLNLRKNKISSHGCRVLAKNLKYIPELLILNLNMNGIGDMGCCSLAENLQFIPLLHTLVLWENGIGEAGCRSLAKHLKHVAHLRTLYLGHNRISDAGSSALADALQFLPRLCILHLDRTHMGEVGCRALAENFKYIPQLHTLTLSGNHIENAGCYALAANLKFISRLEQLDLSENWISKLGSFALTHNIHLLPQLKSFQL